MPSVGDIIRHTKPRSSRPVILASEFLDYADECDNWLGVIVEIDNKACLVLWIDLFVDGLDPGWIPRGGFTTYCWARDYD